ncbi:helix-turn-helix domain-containing protein [Tsukamurella sp. DT100]|uniref:helix-turn-helix domain-containing protein n=1 Tax=Tsukamurella sp. DT100 TaxID=3393415 RepID=UPI003CE8D415
MVKGKAGPEPQWEKRQRFAELIGAGHTIADAAREVGIHYRTGRTWDAWTNGRPIVGEHASV